MTDGHAGYNSLGKRSRDDIVHTKVEWCKNDANQGYHWTISLLKRWLLGPHASAVHPNHPRVYLDEYAFRHNRRKTNGSCRQTSSSKRVASRWRSTEPP